MFYYERKALKLGFERIAGIDEAGRGPLAGPVVAASIILKAADFKNRIDDSKKLTPKARSKAYGEILKKAWIGVGVVGEKRIDEINIYQATIEAMECAVRNLPLEPDMLLIDGPLRLDVTCGSYSIIKGDSKSLSIACASIVAKVTRDRMMENLHKKYPRYSFLRNKGYGTKEHIRAILKHGPSPVHRMSFNPTKKLLE